MILLVLEIPIFLLYLLLQVQQGYRVLFEFRNIGLAYDAIKSLHSNVQKKQQSSRVRRQQTSRLPPLQKYFLP